MTLRSDKPLKCKNIGYKNTVAKLILYPMFLHFKGLSDRKVVLSVTAVTLDCRLKSFVLPALKKSRDWLLKDKVEMKPALR